MNKSYEGSTPASRSSGLLRFLRNRAVHLLLIPIRWGGDLLHLVHVTIARPRDAPKFIWNYAAQHLLNVVTALALIWIWTLAWGEASAFSKSIESCTWKTWEQWPPDAVPHHLVFVADPQLVDPHTYPGRPWPLSTMTVYHTDMYLRRAYSRIQTRLDPDTIIFLGDLFDGGREWSTQSSESPEEQYRKYGEKFWKNEFARFSKIFLREWDTSRNDRAPPRTIIASLPGNHDLGFGSGIQKAVRDRFNAYFGDGNRVDIIGNHSFVSLDTVSLSAMSPADPGAMQEIWSPPETFLASVGSKKADAIAAFLNQSRQAVLGEERTGRAVDALDKTAGTKDGQTHTAEQYTDPTVLASSYDFPTVLLTHVPLYRSPGTPCGPLRERHPPTTPPPGQTTPVNPDERNSLFVGGFGYQYQNVLADSLTRHIISKLDRSVSYAFSGDDHDYCEVVHTAYGSPPESGGIREITVKSLSWAMGVRRPGFLLVSLLNEVDGAGRRVGDASQRTLQTHLCLLPDQLGILIRYGALVGISLIVLLVRAIVHAKASRSRSNSLSGQNDATSSFPLLPTAIPPSSQDFFGSASRTRPRAISSAEREKAQARPSSLTSLYQVPFLEEQQNTSAAASSNSATRSSAAQSSARSRAFPPQFGGDGSVSAADIYDPWKKIRDDVEERDETDDWGHNKGKDRFWQAKAGRRNARKGFIRRVVETWVSGVMRVGVVAGVWFAMLWLHSL